MPPQRKLIYQLSREAGLSNAEIAEKLDLSKKTGTPTVKSDGISNVYLTEDTKTLYAGADLNYNYKDCLLYTSRCV